MNLSYLSRGRPQQYNDRVGIGYVVMNRAPQMGWSSVRHNIRRNYKKGREYEAVCKIKAPYVRGFHLFRSITDARRAYEMGVNVIVKCIYRNPLAFGHVKLGGTVDLDTGKKIGYLQAAVVVARHRMIIEEVD